MNEQPNNPGTRGKWIAAIVATLVVLALAAGGLYLWLRGRIVWTDDQTIRVRQSQATLRQVLWSDPKPIQPGLNTADQEYEPAAPNQGQELFFVRGLPGKGADLYVSTRQGGAWSAPRPLTEINTEHDELGPRLTPDGRFLLFYSDRPGGLGQYDIWAAPRKGDKWGKPFNLGPTVNSPYNDYSPAPSPDGQRLYFASNRKAAAKQEGVAWRATIREAALGDYDLFVCRAGNAAIPGRSSSTTAPSGGKESRARMPALPAPAAPTTQPALPLLAFAPATELDGVNTPYHDGACSVSPAGDFLYFASNRPGGLGGFDLYRARLRDGRCSDVENLGPQVNTPDNDTDPQAVLGGFYLYFSSDRPGGSGGYDLYEALSREVYALREPRPLPTLGWSWYALLIALGLMIPLLLWLRAVGYRHLSLLQKCLAVSLLIHLLLTTLFSVIVLSRQLVEYVAREAGMTVAVNLELSRQVEVSLQVRKQLTDLPLAEAAPAELKQVQMPAPTQAQPHLAELNVPQAQVRPSALAIQPEAPKVRQPQPAEQLSLPAPQLLAQAPRIQVLPAQPVRARADQAPPAPQEPAAAQPIRFEPPRPVVRVQPDTPLPPAQLNPQAILQPVELARLSALQPMAQPSAQPLEAQPAQPLAQATPIRLAPTTQPAASQEASPQAAPDQPKPIQMAQAQPQPLRTAAPDARAGAEQALPASRIVPASTVTMADIRHQAPPAPLPGPALDVPALSESVRIQLPVAGPAGPPAPADQPPAVATAIQAPRPLEARPISLSPTSRPVNVARSDQPIPPGELPRLSLVRDRPGQAPRAASVDGPVETPPQIAFVTPIAGPIGPGKLASPESLFQRSFEQRQKLIREMGGSKESEEAVGRALGFLARQQEADGHWESEIHRGKGRGMRERPAMALTGLAALSFLASDHTPHKPGPYREVVGKAIDYLLSRMSAQGDLRDGGDMYSQAIATLAVAEAATMTGEPRYREAAVKAAGFILRAQNPQTGGWRYVPGDPGDTSVVGWQVMALHSVQTLGLEIPKTARDGALRWISHVSSGPQRMLAGYQGPNPLPSMTAEAVFTRILLDQQFTAAQEQAVADYLLQHPPGQGPANYYYWYYATLALSQMRGPAWEKWNGLIQGHLRQSQSAGGDLDGSWNTNSVYGKRGGRIYTTALNALTLEVYYRYLPMYKGEKK